MSQGDWIRKWLLYAAMLLPILLLENTVLNRYPVFGVFPVLLPLCAVSVGVLEGFAAGASYGLFAGILCDALSVGGYGAMTFFLSLAGGLSGAATRYVLRPNLLGCLLCCLGTLCCANFARSLAFLLLEHAPLSVLLRFSCLEVLYSLPFCIPIYFAYRFLYRRANASVL